MTGWDEALRLGGLIRAIARGFAGRGLDEDDLFQEGMLVASKAVEHFDPARHVSLKTFVGVCVRRHLIYLTRPLRRHRHAELAADVIPARGERFDPAEWAAVRQALSRLEERDRLLISRLYGLDADPITAAAIGDELEVTQKTLHRWKLAALERLRGRIADGVYQPFRWDEWDE